MSFVSGKYGSISSGSVIDSHTVSDGSSTVVIPEIRWSLAVTRVLESYHLQRCWPQSLSKVSAQGIKTVVGPGALEAASRRGHGWPWISSWKRFCWFSRGNHSFFLGTVSWSVSRTLRLESESGLSLSDWLLFTSVQICFGQIWANTLK